MKGPEHGDGIIISLEYFELRIEHFPSHFSRTHIDDYYISHSHEIIYTNVEFISDI